MTESTLFVLASNNKGKLAELKTLLGGMGLRVLSQSEAGCELSVEETGESFAENALLKARAACEATGLPAIADDSGLAVEALGGAPGVKSARYGGESCKTDADRCSRLLESMEGVSRRRAAFICAVVCVFPDGTTLSARGECRGELLYAPRGENGFGYDPVFKPEGMEKSMAELTDAEKNAVSHRGAALRAFEKELRGTLC